MDGSRTQGFDMRVAGGVNLARGREIGSRRRSVAGRRSRVLAGVLVGLTMVNAGCGAMSGSSSGEAAEPVPVQESSLLVRPGRPEASAPADERVCEAVATVLFLVVERVMVVAAEAPIAERAAVEDAYVEARRAVPADLTDALREVEEVYDRIGAEYLALVAQLRGGAPYDPSQVVEVFESRRPELREIFERTGLDGSCERLYPNG